MEFLLTSDEPVSGEEIGERLGVSRTAIWKQIQQLRDEGYLIEGSPKKGYTLLNMKDPLFREEVNRALQDMVFGYPFFLYESLSSTNETIKELGREGYPEGTLVIAEEQTGGKGRKGRTWSSKKGQGLWFSLLLRPPVAIHLVSQLTFVASVALTEVLREMRIPVGIKWPNDLLLDGKKVCGILAETVGEIDRVDFVVLGIGLNVHQSKGDFPEDIQGQAISLSLGTGWEFKRLDILTGFLKSFSHWYEKYRQEGFAVIQKQWKEYSLVLGHDVLIMENERTREGKAIDLGEDGALLVDVNGEVIKFFTGDVSLRYRF